MTKNEIAAVNGEIFNIMTAALGFVNDRAVPLLMMLPPDEQIKTVDGILNMIACNAFNPITQNKKTVN